MANYDQADVMTEESEVPMGQNELKEEQEEQNDKGDDASAGAKIDVDSFDELSLSNEMVEAAQEAWNTFINSAASREAAGEAIYAALFDAAPSLQSLFTTPRAIQAMKFMNGLNQFVGGLSDPSALKVLVETLGFGHLDLAVTVPRVVIFRDAILDLLRLELGSRFSAAAHKGWQALLNYVGGAIIYVKRFYADRIKLLDESWGEVNHSKAENDNAGATGDMNENQQEKTEGGDGEGDTSTAKTIGQRVPTTFNEMFQFNAVVMGFGSSMWMSEVLACFDNIVTNVSNSQRLVEECDFLVCRISRASTGKVNLAEFKSCMLAALRSLLPKSWTTAHEVAWSWLWENVERTLMKNLGMPPTWEKAYSKLLDSVDEATGFQLRRDIYLTFFSLAPAGQDYFKQSNTYLHLIATKVLMMVMDIFRNPVRLVDDISALGLRHVGYAIPTEYMPPFASACVQVVQGLTQDQVCIDGFQWSIGLLAKSLVRTIVQGSTIVMKSININTKKSMIRSLSVAPRGERSKWMLLIQVGTQNISPLAWAIESSSLESASAMIRDLLTFRADRDKYYYAADDLFTRHPNIVQMLFDNAPALAPELLDGLVWRSRVSIQGFRRVNYYVKHLLVDVNGGFAKNLSWVNLAGDTQLVRHPVVVLVSDLVWSLAARSFLIRKAVFSFTLICFLTSQSIIPHMKEARGYSYDYERYTIVSLKVFIYGFSMGANMIHHANTIANSYKKGDTTTVLGHVPLPSYLLNWQESLTFFLMCLLLCMLSTDPILFCLQDDSGLVLTDLCKGSSQVTVPHSIFSMLCCFAYFALLTDLAVFNDTVSAYTLVANRLTAELTLFLTALAFVILTFSSGMSCLHQTMKEFHGIHRAAESLLEMTLGVFGHDRWDSMHGETSVLAGAFFYMLVASIFLLNLLIAQVTAAYAAVYQNMLGFARLKRIQITLGAMPQVPRNRFEAFVASLHFERRIEFNEGDIGLSNGIAVTEPANAHPTFVDMIKRFGGSTSPSIQWPEEAGGDDESDKFDRLETLIKRMGERRGKEHASRSRNKASSLDASGSGGDGGHSSNSEADQEAVAEQEEDADE